MRAQLWEELIKKFNVLSKLVKFILLFEGVIFEFWEDGQGEIESGEDVFRFFEVDRKFGDSCEDSGEDGF